MPQAADAAENNGAGWRARWLPSSTCIYLTIFLGLLAVGRSKLLQDPGTFWHTVLGQHWLAGGELARSDTFTFTHAGRPWLALQWLGDALMGLCHGVGGWDTLLLATAAVVAGTYTWLARRWCRAGFHPLAAAALMALAIASSSHHFHARPHLATIVCIGVTFAWLCDVEAGRAPLLKLGWLVPLFALWANLHGGVLAGLATVGLAAAGWSVAALVGKPSPVSGLRDALSLVALGLLLSVALFANPYGAAMPRAWLAILRMPLPELIQEHRRLSLLSAAGAMTVLLGLGYAWALVDALRTAPCRGNRRAFVWPAVTWLIPLAWFLLACSRVRHAPLFVIVAAVASCEVLPRTRLAALLAEWDFFSPPVEKPAARGEPRRFGRWLVALRPAAVPLGIAALALSLQASRVPAPLLGSGWARHDPARWPVALLGDLRRLEARSPRGTPIFNTLDFGGFLTYHAPGLKTFIDDRCELFGTEFLAAYAAAERHEPERLDAWAARWGFRHALTRTGTPLGRHLEHSPDWHAVRRTPTATLFERRDGSESLSARAAGP